MLGLIDGLRRRDVDLAAADLIVGTSAGLHRRRHPPRRARAGRRAPDDWPTAAYGSRRNQAEVRPPAARVGQSAGRAWEHARDGFRVRLLLRPVASCELASTGAWFLATDGCRANARARLLLALRRGTQPPGAEDAPEVVR